MATASLRRPIPVGFLVSTLTVGGAERQLQHLIGHLDREIVRPHLYTLRGPGPIGTLLAEEGVPLASGLAPARFPSPWALTGLAARVRNDAIQLLYCLDHTNAAVAGVVAARLAGRLPVLLAVHTTGQWGKASIPRPVRMVLGGVTRLLAIAEAQREYLIRTEGIPSNKILVIRNGIPPLDPAQLPSKSQAREALGIDADEGPVIGILAMLRPEKAHENFLEAARAISTRFPRSRFLCIGGGPRREELETLSITLGIGERVDFLGTRDDVPQILPALDLSVLASHPRVETLPLSQMEAMSLEIPVVATRVGALAELITDGVEGRLVPPGDVTALAGAITELLGDEARARAAGQAARRRILGEFTAERVARETEAVILESLRELR